MEAEKINIYSLAIPSSHHLQEVHSTHHLTEKQTSGLRPERRLNRSSRWVTVYSPSRKYRLQSKQQSQEEFCDLTWEQVASMLWIEQRGVTKTVHWRLMFWVTLVSGCHHWALYVCKCMTVHQSLHLRFRGFDTPP